jgi:hypothetical protein
MNFHSCYVGYYSFRDEDNECDFEKEKYKGSHAEDEEMQLL